MLLSLKKEMKKLNEKHEQRLIDVYAAAAHMLQHKPFTPTPIQPVTVPSVSNIKYITIEEDNGGDSSVIDGEGEEESNRDIVKGKVRKGDEQGVGVGGRGNEKHLREEGGGGSEGKDGGEGEGEEERDGEGGGEGGEGDTKGQEEVLNVTKGEAKEELPVPEIEQHIGTVVKNETNNLGEVDTTKSKGRGIETETKTETKTETETETIINTELHVERNTLRQVQDTHEILIMPPPGSTSRRPSYFVIDSSGREEGSMISSDKVVYSLCVCVSKCVCICICILYDVAYWTGQYCNIMKHK